MILTDLKHTCNRVNYNLQNVIIEAVAKVYDVDIVRILGSSREAPLPEARKMNYYVHYECGFHIVEISNNYTTSRSSVYTALSDIPDFIKIYPEIQEKYNAIIKATLKKIKNEANINTVQIEWDA